jgi:hypothetical protein
MPEEKILAKLGEKGIPAEAPRQTLAEVAKQYRRTPQEAYAVLQTSTPAATAPAAHVGAAMGLGVKSVSDVASELGISSKTAVARLKEHDIKAQPHDMIRAVAVNANMRPFEVVELLKQAAESPNKRRQLDQPGAWHVHQNSILIYACTRQFGLESVT